jgi:hypothetical protein
MTKLISLKQCEGSDREYIEVQTSSRRYTNLEVVTCTILGVVSREGLEIKNDCARDNH